jgi:hypothetical protein
MITVALGAIHGEKISCPFELYTSIFGYPGLAQYLD